jgi:hypothetical protein
LPCSLPTAHCQAFVTACTMSLCHLWLCTPCCLAPCGCMHRIALPLATACPTLPCPLQLHAPDCRGPCLSWLRASHRHGPCSLHQLIICLYTFFFPFSTNFLFCSQSLCPLSRPLMVATWAHLSIFVVTAVAASRACFMLHSLPWAPMPQVLQWWLLSHANELDAGSAFGRGR